MMQGEAQIPTAKAGGKLWGKVECFILDDGRRVIGQRAILRSLENPEKTSGAGTGHLDRFLARLPKRFQGLTSGAEIEFRIPWEQGGSGRAIGRPTAFFVDVLCAYGEALDAG